MLWLKSDTHGKVMAVPVKMQCTLPMSLSTRLSAVEDRREDSNVTPALTDPRIYLGKAT